MATPTNAVYTKANTPIYGGRSALPSWLPNQASWGIVPLTVTFADLDPRNDPLINPNYPAKAEYEATGSFINILRKWNGATRRQSTSEIYFPLQGGHADWAGNDAYKVILNSESPRVVRLQNPSGWDGAVTTNDGQEATGLYSDGRVRSIHSYNKHVYREASGPICGRQGNCATSGSSGTSNLIVFDHDCTQLQFGPFPTTNPGSSVGTGVCYDPSRDCLWSRGSGTGRIQKWVYGDASWTTAGPLNTGTTYNSLTYIDTHDLVAWVSVYNGGLSIYDPVTDTLTAPGLTGSLVGMSIVGQQQPEWVNGRLCMWDNSTNTTIINTLTPTGDPRTDPWEIGQLTVDAGNTVTPAARDTDGTYGRFGWLPGIECFYLVPPSLTDIYVFRPDWG